MKTLLISLVLLGAANHNLANASNNKSESESTSSNEVNSYHEYRTQAQNSLTPNQVKSLEDDILNWDVKNTNLFQGSKSEVFKVRFQSTSGYAIVSYDNNGEILATEEYFYNVALPKNLVRSILKEYPGWEFSKSKYFLLYNKNTGIKKTFKVQIQKNDTKIWLDIDSSGNIS